jgi:hypothetical protein
MFTKMEVNKMTYFKHFCHQVEELLILVSTVMFISIFIAVSVNLISSIT